MYVRDLQLSFSSSQRLSLSFLLAIAGFYSNRSAYSSLFVRPTDRPLPTQSPISSFPLPPSDGRTDGGKEERGKRGEGRGGKKGAVRRLLVPASVSHSVGRSRTGSEDT